MMIPKDFKPKFQYDLIRLGKNNDGGYLVEKNSIIDSDKLISAGISWDFSFEKDYINLSNKSVLFNNKEDVVVSVFILLTLLTLLRM